MAKPLSYSRMRMFLACPRQYQYRLEHTAQRGLPAIMVRGKFAHVFYELYTSHCVKENSMQCLSELDQIAALTYKTATFDAGLAGEPILTPLEWQDVYEKLCRPWAERTALPVDNIRACEHRWAVTRDGLPIGFDSPEAWLRGVIDRLDDADDGAVLVTDYKTGYGGTGDPMQADIYALATLLLNPTVSIVRVVFEHTATDYLEMTEYTRDALKSLRPSIRALADIIHTTENFNPRPGVACAECPFAYCCDAEADLPDGITDEKQARQAVEAITLLERDLKNVKGALRQWCEGHGPVDHNGIAWGVWKSDGLGFHDAEKFMHCCADASIDPYPFLSVNNTKAKRLQKTFPDIVTENPSFSFRSKKSTGKDE
jgi:RecB family exonuclease